MARRMLVSLVCVALLAAGVWLAGQSNKPAQAQGAKKPAKGTKAGSFPAPAGFVVFPYLQYATPTSITVMWETTLPGSSTVRYGLTGLTKSAEGAKDATMHEVTLSGLEPGKPHVYQVESANKEGKVTSPLLTFQTAVGPDQVFSFVLMGDTQRNPVVTRKIASLAWQRRPNFAIHLGDVVDAGPIQKQWTNDLFGSCRELFSRVPVYPCIGNHERNHANYYKYFSLPAPEYHYKFRYGNAEFFSLDTNKKVGPGTEQFKWLDAELAKSTAKWKFCFHHHPPYSSDDNDFGNTWKGDPSRMGDKNARSLVELYEKHGVDLAFNGHVHVYERTWPLRAGKVDRARGITYITSAGGGAGLENFGPVPTFFKAQCRSDYHFCYVTIHGGRFSMRVFDKDGILFDTFDLEK